MMMRAAFIWAVLALTACATTQVEVTPVNIEPFQKIEAEDFDSAQTSAHAEDSFAAEDYKTALRSYAKVYAFDTSEVKALAGQAKSHLALGEYEKAASIYWRDDWPETTPEQSKELAIGKILSGIYTDRFEAPTSAIHDGMILSPNDARLWNAKGQYHDRQEEWMEALAAYLEAMKTGKWQAGTINNMGMSLLLQDRLDEAKSKFEHAVNLKPDNEIYENNLRMIFILQGDIKTALKGLDESRASDILNDAGYVVLQKDKTALAQKLFEKALEISPVYHAKAKANLDAISRLETAARSKSAGTTP